MITSAFLTVDNRWAIIIVVRPTLALNKVQQTILVSRKYSYVELFLRLRSLVSNNNSTLPEEEFNNIV